MRISRGRVAAIVAAAVVVVVAIVVLVDRGDSDDPLPVEVAAYGDYPGRGPKIGDQKLLDAAAQAWRDDTDADERPGDDVEALYAGGMSDLQLRPGFGGYDNVRDVVVLASRTSIATATHQADGSWGIDAVTRTLSSLETDPVIDLGNGAYLVADRFDSNSEAIELPQVRLDGAESPQTPSSEPDGPRRFAAELGRVLWSPQQRGSGSFVVRLPGTKQGTFAGQAWLLADANDQDRPAFTTAAGKAGSDDELWAQLLSPRDSANTVIAVGTGLEEIHLQATRNDIYGPALPIRPLGSAMLRDTPDGDRRISAIALGRPGGWGWGRRRRARRRRCERRRADVGGGAGRGAPDCEEWRADRREVVQVGGRRTSVPCVCRQP